MGSGARAAQSDRSSLYSYCTAREDDDDDDEDEGDNGVLAGNDGARPFRPYYGQGYDGIDRGGLFTNSATLGRPMETDYRNLGLRGSRSFGQDRIDEDDDDHFDDQQLDYHHPSERLWPPTCGGRRGDDAVQEAEFGNDVNVTRRLQLRPNRASTASELQQGQGGQRRRRSWSTAAGLLLLVLCWVWNLLKAAATLIVIVAAVVIGLIFYRGYTCSAEAKMGLNVTALEENLSANLFGQPFAVETLMSVARQFSTGSGYFGNEVDHAGGPPSVWLLILAGGSGTGKTLASSLIRNSFSPVINSFSLHVPVHFDKGAEDAADLLQSIADRIKASCGPSLVILDDLDVGRIDLGTEATEDSGGEYEKYLLERVTSIVSKVVASREAAADEYFAKAQPRDASGRRRTLLVVTTNAGASEIESALIELVKEARTVPGLPEVKAALGNSFPVLVRLERSLRSALPAALAYVKVVPFAPLSRMTVRQCVQKELRSRRSGGRFSRDTEGAAVEAVLRDMRFLTKDHPVFSTVGCKTVAAKLDALTEDVLV